MRTITPVDKAQILSPELPILPPPRQIRERPFVNPYCATIREFSGRIFLFEQFEEDLLQVRALFEGRQTIVELGCGSGQHLIAKALANPAAICLGLEVRYKRCVRAIQKAKHRGADNLFILRVNARELRRIFGPHTIDQLYVLFPDPWNKRREQKHRLLSASFLKECQLLLRAQGYFVVKTDAELYFSWFLEQVQLSSAFSVKEVSHHLHLSKFALHNIVTEFEEMFLAQGLAIHYAKLDATDNDLT